MLNNIAAHFDEDPSSRNHLLLRETAWMGGEFVEARYLLSWATGVNEFRRSHEEFEAEYQAFVINTWPESQMFLKSRYWRKFFLVLLWHQYRESKIGVANPIQSEAKEDRALRMLMTNPAMSHAELAKALKTTEKQLQRMSSFQLAYRELSWNFVYPEPTTKQPKR
jgi:hypothetical protein